MHHKDKITYLIEELREELHNLLERQVILMKKY